MNQLNRSRTLLAWLCAAGLLSDCCTNTLARTHYVDVNGTNATSPYLTWATAATNIQDAVDAAVAGDEIVVTNGTYSSGERAVGTNLLANRVAVDRPVTLRSLNGPQFTIIQGRQVPSATNGDGAIRCVYLANGASLSGFTLTNGGTRASRGTAYDSTYPETAGGGLWCESTEAVVVSNCVLSGNSAWDSGGGAYGGTLNNCTLAGNSAWFGGGAYAGTLNNCTLSGNWAGYGGGAAQSTLNNCKVENNLATINDDGYGGQGGGAHGSFLNYCTISSNSAAVFGGGTTWGSLTCCALLGNSSRVGGGAAAGVLNNCVVRGNSATSDGGGVARLLFEGGGGASAALYNCTLSGNFAADSGGGANHCNLFNCIAYFNTSGHGPNYDASSFLNYCCTTLLPTNGFGNITNTPLFVDTNGWANLRLQSNSPCINAGNNAYAVGSRDLDGNPRINRGTVDMGAYEFQAGVHYVDVNSTNATPPYTTWATAATIIQDAVDAAVAGDEVVVTNGIYATGGRSVDGLTTNRVAVDKPLTVRSINGPEFTTIDGGYAGRCLSLTNAVNVSGFTITHGLAAIGAGLWCASTNTVVSRCVVSSNLTSFPEGRNPLGVGGGAFGATLNNCTLIGNLARGANAFGGGAANSMLNNCTLTGSGVYAGGQAQGGGAWSSTINNSIILDGAASSLLNHCWTGAPLFVDQASGDVRLQSNSPCINAGDNAFAPAGPDLGGNPRITGGTVDIGAYEFQLPASKVSYAWLYQYGLPINASTDAADPDSDGVDNYHEWLAGSDPTNPFSFPPLLTLIPYGANVILTWPTNAVGFTVQSATNVGSTAAWVTNSPAPVVIGGQNVVINPVTSLRQFYRLVH